MKSLRAASLFFLLCSGGATGASLQVSPVHLEVTAPGATATVTLRNNSARAVATQSRVFRWLQVGDEERLEPTEDVVVSPPAAELSPDQNYIVRVVRVAGKPIEGEEAYRLLIDELPEEPRRTHTVNFVLRQSIPLLFVAQDASPPDVTWKVAQNGRAVSLTAANSGDRRFRVATMTIRDSSGKTISSNQGLVGYVLGHSSMTWKFPTRAALRAGAKVTVEGRSDEGLFSAPIAVQAAH